MKYYKNTRWNMGKYWKYIKEKKEGPPVDIDKELEEEKGHEVSPK